MTMEKPACYGNVSFVRDSVCATCQVIGMCAERRTRNERFGVMVWPRIAIPVPAAIGETPLVMTKEPELLAKLAAPFKQFGMHYLISVDTWCMHGAKVFRVREANAARIVIDFFDVPIGHVQATRAAMEGVQLAISYCADMVGPATRDGIEDRKRLGSLGTVATTVSVETAVNLCIEIMKRHYSGSERE